VPLDQEHLKEAERIERKELPKLREALNQAEAEFYAADQRRVEALDAYNGAVQRMGDARLSAKAQARP
jgi:hypothetical protein